MIILIKLILAHLTGDFLLQPKNWVEDKEQKKWSSSKLYLHALIHGALVLILLGNLRLWYLAVLIFIIHYFIDLLKATFQKEGNKIRWFISDQILHLLSLVILWIIFFEPHVNFTWIYQSKEWWLYITAFFFLTVPSSVLLSVVLSNWTEKIKDDQSESLANAGKYIGILERLFVFVFIVTNHWEAVGFLLTAKSVFRFGDLKESKDRKLTEYILIGTLLSFGVAVIVGIVVSNIAA
ncbi:MAG: DUF3307 domain-containing protein [Chlorobi bacterium]|nr:DUF3307 domain-containing protein [Chlorobiota bacterium]